MTEQLEAQVLIVGAGPVGLTLAIDLAQRGIDVLVTEIRHRGEPPNVKCNHVAARSMEVFRRLGVAQALRDAGLPADYPNDVAYRTAVAGMELSRIPIPARRDRYTATGGPDTWWPTAEPPHRINQIFLEPVLFAHAEATPGLRIRNRTRIDDLEQDDDGVWATGVDLDDGRAVRIRCQHLVGCDGARSTVRKKIGASLHGTDVVGRVQSTYFRAPALLGLLKHAPAWATFALNPRRCGNVYAIDGRETWLLHNYLLPEETDFDAIDRDWAIRQILGVGDDFEYEVISNEDWVGRRLVADRFRDRRVFICGDAAHLWIPMAGYGMNAGIADAMNLSWLLAGRLHGWLGEAALAAHEAERQPITEQVSKFAMNHALALQRQREGVPEDIEAPGPEGEALRARARPGAVRPERAAVLLRRAELRLLLRRLAAHRLRRRGRTRVHDVRVHALDRAGLPHAAPVGWRRPLALRRDGRAWRGLHAAALRPRDRRRRHRGRRRGARRAAAHAGRSRRRSRHGQRRVRPTARHLAPRPARGVARIRRAGHRGRCARADRPAARRRRGRTDT
jgi:2-polyprenyl-6-methoxyphenol hydroxylase-like FAD-dependent oxidoreductase